MKRVLVTGATGFIGLEVSKQLAHAGYKPRLMVRRPLRAMALGAIDAEMMQGDLSRPESLKRLLKDVDTVIHLGARATFDAYEILKPSIVNGSLNLFHAARQAGVEKFVYGGSLLVYGKQKRIIDQNTPAAPNSGYARAKLEAETALGRMAAESGMAFVSLRLPHVYGAMSLLFDQVRDGRVVFPGRGDNPFAHLHVADTARALIRSAEIGLTGIYAVADEQSCTWNEFFDTIHLYYPRLTVRHVPRWFALLGTSLLDLIAAVLKRPNRFSRGAVENWNMVLPVVKRTLPNTVGLAPLYPSIHQGVPAVLDECIAFAWLHSIRDPF